MVQQCTSRVLAGLTAALINWNAILLPVSLVAQHHDYDCGPAALKSVLSYHGIEAKESDLVRQAECNREFGTEIPPMKRTLESHGLKVHYQSGATLEQLKESLEQDNPPIVLIQAWSNEEDTGDYSDNWEDGHYVVVAGIDSKEVTIMDPYRAQRYRSYSHKEFLKRWHGEDRYLGRLDHAVLIASP